MDEDNSETISLHKAILDNDFEKVQYLIGKGADLNLSDSKGLNPLQLAIMTNNVKIVAELMTRCKQINLDMYTYQLVMMLDNTVMWDLLKKHYNRFLHSKDLQNMKNSQGETIVHYAVRYRSIKMLNECIEAQLNINDIDIHGFSPLHLAVINNDTKIVKLLIKSGADVSAKTLDGRSAIHFAVQYQCYENLLLLKDFVNVPIISSGGYPLHIAVENNDERTFNLLIEAGANIHCKDNDGKNLLHVAVENQHEVLVNILLRKGVDVNARFGEKEQSVIELALISKNPRIILPLLSHNPDLNSKNKDGLNALFIAIENKCLKAVRKMFSLKPDFSAVTNDNVTLLHYALIHQQEYIVNYFLKNNMSISEIDNEGRNALHYAAEYSDKKVVLDLIINGLDVNSRTSKNLTPLHFAVSRNNYAAVEALLGNGADINAEDANRQTPLFYSLIHRSAELIDPCNYKIRKEMVKLLLVKGADVNLFDKMGNTALYYLMSNQYLGDSEELVLYFIQLGANMNSVNSCNDNILHIYLKYGQQESIVDLFLNSGGNVNQLNNSHQTPLEIYLESGRVHSNTFEFLINKGARMTKNKMGENALHLVVKIRAEKTMQIILDRKLADLYGASVDGSTVLHYAIKYAPSWTDNDKRAKWDDDILGMLLWVGANVNARDKEGKTPLHLAVMKDYLHLVETLLSNDADVNLKDAFENSPLCYAISNKNMSMIKLLLQKGASTSDRHRGLSILDLANQTGDTQVSQLITSFFKND